MHSSCRRCPAPPGFRHTPARDNPQASQPRAKTQAGRDQTDTQARGQQRSSRPHASEGAFGCVLTSAALAERAGARGVSHRRRWRWRCCVVEDELWALGRRRTRSRSIDRLHLNSGGEAVSSSSSSSTLRAESASRPSRKASSSCSSLLRVVHLAVGVRRKVRLEVGLLRRGLARCDALGNAIP